MDIARKVCGSQHHARHIERVLQRVDMEPLIAERVASCDLMIIVNRDLVLRQYQPMFFNRGAMK